MFSVIAVEDAEIAFNADEYLDHTGQKPVIYISPNECDLNVLFVSLAT
jgi:GH25 family lysozyme M1 (1,4-beta-N-acetylmuramidase)